MSSTKEKIEKNRLILARLKADASKAPAPIKVSFPPIVTGGTPQRLEIVKVAAIQRTQSTSQQIETLKAFEQTTTSTQNARMADNAIQALQEKLEKEQQQRQKALESYKQRKPHFQRDPVFDSFAEMFCGLFFNKKFINLSTLQTSKVRMEIAEALWLTFHPFKEWDFNEIWSSLAVNGKDPPLVDVWYYVSFEIAASTSGSTRLPLDIDPIDRHESWTRYITSFDTDAHKQELIENINSLRISTVDLTDLSRLTWAAAVFGFRPGRVIFKPLPNVLNSSQSDDVQFAGLARQELRKRPNPPPPRSQLSQIPPPIPPRPRIKRPAAVNELPALPVQPPPLNLQIFTAPPPLPPLPPPQPQQQPPVPPPFKQPVVVVDDNVFKDVNIRDLMLSPEETAIQAVTQRVTNIGDQQAAIDNLNALRGPAFKPPTPLQSILSSPVNSPRARAEPEIDVDDDIPVIGDLNVPVAPELDDDPPQQVSAPKRARTVITTEELQSKMLKRATTPPPVAHKDPMINMMSKAAAAILKRRKHIAVDSDDDNEEEQAHSSPPPQPEQAPPPSEPEEKKNKEAQGKQYPRHAIGYVYSRGKIQDHLRKFYQINDDDNFDKAIQTLQPRLTNTDIDSTLRQFEATQQVLSGVKNKDALIGLVEQIADQIRTTHEESVRSHAEIHELLKNMKKEQLVYLLLALGVHLKPNTTNTLVLPRAGVREVKIDQASPPTPRKQKKRTPPKKKKTDPQPPPPSYNAIYERLFNAAKQKEEATSLEFKRDHMLEYELELEEVMVSQFNDALVPFSIPGDGQCGYYALAELLHDVLPADVRESYQRSAGYIRDRIIKSIDKMTPKEFDDWEVLYSSFRTLKLHSDNSEYTMSDKNLSMVFGNEWAEVKPVFRKSSPTDSAFPKMESNVSSTVFNVIKEAAIKYHYKLSKREIDTRLVPSHKWITTEDIEMALRAFNYPYQVPVIVVGVEGYQSLRLFYTRSQQADKRTDFALVHRRNHWDVAIPKDRVQAAERRRES